MSVSEEFNCFPQEDIVWIVEKVEDVDDDDSTADDAEEKHLLSVVDKLGCFIGAKTVPTNKIGDQGLLELLKECFSLPLSGKPRKPTALQIEWEITEHSRNIISALEIDIIDYSTSLLRTGSKKSKYLWRTCDNCGRRGDQQLFEKCSRCSAVFYCNEQCEKKNFEKSSQHSHSQWCPKMFTYVQNANILADFPFSFTQETTSPNFTPGKLLEFLDRLGLQKDELYLRETDIMKSSMIPYGELKWENVDKILKFSPQKIDVTMTNWNHYYNWRCIPLCNPIAALLTNVLSVYHIFNSFIINCNSQKKSYDIHLIGCEKEADQVPVFKELEHLLPNVTLHIAMIGPHISVKCHKQTVSFTRNKVTMYQCQYHKLQLGTPDLIIGLNAGLAAYQSWTSTLQLLQTKKIISYFTDYCRYSCEASKDCVEGLSIGTISEPEINPFRSPLRKYCEEHCMPWFSNAFIYGLLYSD